VSKGIIQTALSQKDHGLEVDYRQPCVSRHGAAMVGALTIPAQLTMGYDELRMWDQITDLFRMI